MEIIDISNGRNDMNDSIFRKKNLERINSPEQLDDYIKVTSVSVWVILISIMLILIGACVWGVYGTVTTSFETIGIVEKGNMKIYISESDFQKIDSNIKVIVNDKEYNVNRIDKDFEKIQNCLKANEIHEAGLDGDEWVHIAYADTELEDGKYNVSVIIENLHFMSFIMN